MNLDLGPAFTRAQAVVHGLVAAIPGLVVALVVFGGFVLVAAVVKGVVARLTETLPVPTQHALFNRQTEDSDGGRARQREGWPAGHPDVPAPRRVADAIHHLSGSKPRGAEGE